MLLNTEELNELLGNDVKYLKSDDTELSSLAYYFPTKFEDETGGEGKLKLTNGTFVKMSRVRNSHLTNVLENQGPGCTDIQVPIKFKYNNNVYVYIFDGASDGAALFKYETYHQAQIGLDLIEFLGLNSEFDEEDDW